jgi:trans-aconitate methyltransferase
MNSQYYYELLAKHGPTYKAIDAGSEHTHRKRLEVLTAMIPNARSSILDVGCGLGHLIEYGHGVTKAGYRGVDVLPEMIQAARSRRPGWRFEVRDILAAKQIWPADYVVASGLFQFATMQSIEQALATMYRLCRKAAAANFLREGEAEECVVSPIAMLRYGLTLTLWVTVRADYLKNDFTIVLFKEKP